ncbi:MAG: hypothetical protein RL422_1639 [Bacteroidota bacterium]|jgi:hypothetical protein
MAYVIFYRHNKKIKLLVKNAKWASSYFSEFVLLNLWENAKWPTSYFIAKIPFKPLENNSKQREVNVE